MLDHPENLVYTHRFLWVMIDSKNGTAKVGVTEELNAKLGEIESFDRPYANEEIEIDHPCLQVHLADNRQVPLLAPLTGRIIEINTDLLDTPALVSLEPYKSWIFEMEYDDESEIELLLNSAKYDKFLDNM